MKNKPVKKVRTRNHFKTLDAIAKFQFEHGYSPSLLEIGEIMGMSPSGIFAHIERLEEMKFLSRIRLLRKTSPRAMTITDKGKNHLRASRRGVKASNMDDVTDGK